MQSSSHPLVWLGLLALLALLLFSSGVFPLSAAPPLLLTSPPVVISQVYGGGGITGYYLNDYVELHNRSDEEVDLTGWSLQYGSASGNFAGASVDLYPFLVGTRLRAGSYLLIQLGTTGRLGNPLPVTPDQIGMTNLAAGSGKLALANTAGSLGCGSTANPCVLPHPQIVDLVAYGQANNGEGGTSVNNGSPLTDQQGAVRRFEGCQDTDDNNADFEVLAGSDLVPRNSQSLAHSCRPTRTPTPTRTATATPTATASPPAAGVVINEFLPQPGTDWNGDGAVNSDDEWVELYNANDYQVDLGGWKLDDLADAGTSPYLIPDQTRLDARSLLLLFHSETNVGLNDDGDTVRLLHRDDSLADSLSYTSSTVDRSFSRRPDGDPFVTSDCVPSPGAFNCLITPTPTITPTPYSTGVVVNEFLAWPVVDWNGDGATNTEDEWIELYNNSDAAVDLGGWKLDDAEGGASPYKLPAGQTIAPHGLAVFFSSQTHISLNDDGDSVRLLHPDGTVADSTSYDSTGPTWSYGRNPDGTGKWQHSCYPTPGQPNCSIVLTPTPTPDYRFTPLSDVRRMPLGSRVTVKGSVVVPPCRFERYGHELMISDGSTGLDLYGPSPARFTCDIRLGEQIAATGSLDERYGLRRLVIDASRDLVRNFGIPRLLAPLELHTGDVGEAIEGMLVSIEGTVTGIRTGDKIWVDDGSGPAEVRTIRYSGASFEGLTLNSLVRITGVGYRDDRDHAPDPGYHLRPRLPQDVEVLELAEKLPPAPGGRGLDLGAVSISTVYSTRVGNYVTVGGTITVPPGVFGDREFWLQDGSGGVHVRVPEEAGSVPSLQLWDNAVARGRIVSYFGEREVLVEQPGSVKAYGSGSPLAPRSIKTGAFALDSEAQLVELEGLIVREAGRRFFIDDGSGQAQVYFNASTLVPVPTGSVGTRLHAVGIVRRYRSQAELVPRYPDDVTLERKLTSTAPIGSHAPVAGQGTGAQAAITPLPTPTPTFALRLAARRPDNPARGAAELALPLLDSLGLPALPVGLALLSGSALLLILALFTRLALGRKDNSR